MNEDIKKAIVKLGSGRIFGKIDEEQLVVLLKFASKRVNDEDAELKIKRVKDTGVELLDKYFPKGKCHERGNALVLFVSILKELYNEFNIKY